MNSTRPLPLSVSAARVRGDNPARRPILLFAAIAIAAGWLLMFPPVIAGWPLEPFVLVVVVVGLVAPAIWLTRRESGGAGIRGLLRDAVRLPRPLWWLPVAALALPVATWGAAAPLGGAEVLTVSLLIGFAVQLLSGAIIINIWEEMAWTGFVQRRAIARWGLVAGSVITALLFAGIHLPLAFDGASTALDVAAGIGVLVSIGIGLRLLIARIDAWSGRSLLTIGLLHASFNATASVVDPDYDWIRLGVTVVLGLAVFVIGGARLGRPARG